MLSDQGVREVTLLGQNVNSYAGAREGSPVQDIPSSSSSSDCGSSDPFSVYARG